MSSKVRCVDISGFQNIESVISQIINEEEFYCISGVRLEASKLVISFLESDKKRTNYVKQVSKKKYKSLDEFFFNSLDNRGGSLRFLINMPKVWLLFFSK